MNRVRQVISFILFLAFIVAIVFGLYKLAIYIWSISNTINPTIVAGIIAGCVTLIVSILSILIQKHKEQQINIKVEHRNKVAPIYENFIDFIFSIVFAKTLGKKELTQQEMMEKLAEFTQKIVVWSSDDVIKAYYNFRLSSQGPLNQREINNLKGLNIVFLVEDLLLAIRKDLGHSNKGLTRGKILGLFVNDIEKYIKK